MKQHAARLMASLVGLVLAACGGAAPPPAAEGGQAGAEAPGAPAAGGAGALASPDTQVAAGTPAASKAILRAPSWMPEGWDESGFLSPSFQNIPEGERMAARVQEAEASLPFLFYMFANDAGLDENNEPVWVLWQAFRSCEKAEQLINDLTAEFGDRERGKAGLAAARKDFLDWAATQPKDMTFQTWVTLGEWSQATSTFPIDRFSHVSTIDLEQAKAAFPHMIDAIAPFMDTYASPSLRPNLIDFWCPSQDGQTLLSFGTQQQTWRMQLGAFDPSKSLPGVPNFSGFPGWPELKMDRDAARAFSEANPERKVRLTFTVAMNQTPVADAGGYVTNLVAKMQSATFTDPSGKVLAKRDY